MHEKEKQWGKTIKYMRQKQSIKQDDLAVGICTISYLSRIENGHVIADTTIYEQLFSRLGINLANKVNQELVDLEQMERIYEKLLSNESVTESEIEHLQTARQQTQNFEVHVMAQLIYSRYLLSINDNSPARKILTDLEPVIPWSYDRMTQLYVSITAFAYLSFMEFEELIHREQQMHCSNFLHNCSLFEQANYTYHLAFAYHRSYHFSQALKYIDFAFAQYTHQYKPLFQLKLYSMKGVILNDLHRFKEALIEYQAGIELLTNVNSIQSNRQWSSLYNNLAYCYECQQDFHKACHYYELANAYEEDLHSAINWLRASYQQQNFEQTRELLKRYPEQVFHVSHHLLQRELIEFACQGEFTIDALREIEEHAFSHFESKQYYALTLYYAPLWAKFYEQLHANKHAARCYQLAYKASEKVRQRMSS